MNHKSLFASHYLQHRLPEQAEWQEDMAGPLQALYEAKKGLLPQASEAATEDEWILPLLHPLGFSYTVQPKKTGGAVRIPDYALFASEAHKAETIPYQKTDETAFYGRLLAIAKAKYWERLLTQLQADATRGDFDNRNPSFQIVNYLIGTGVDWGVLTNGRLSAIEE